MLQTKTIDRYTVSQMGPLESARLRLFQRQIEPLIKGDEVMAEALNEWALVAACTVPFIPRDEYLQMPLSETMPLVQAVEELNSDLSAPGEAKKKQ